MNRLPSQGPGDAVTGSQEEVVILVSHMYQPKEAACAWEEKPILAHLLSSYKQ